MPMRKSSWMGLLAGLALIASGCGDDGSDNTNQNDNANQNGSPVCGNGIVETGEQCDEGAANNDSEPGACRTTCRTAYCGDGVVDLGETCDDGNPDDTDGCLSTCVPAACGDGFTWAGTEACDPEDPANGAECRPDCSQDLARCGNSTPDAGEDCDLGDANADVPNAPCRTDCQVPTCGDGIRDDQAPRFEACDCGTDIQALPEGCITTNVDGVANACKSDCSAPACGDGLVDNLPEYGEACDEGADNCDDADTCTCSTTCQLPGCGNGSVEAWRGEACDEGAGNCNDEGCTCGLTCQLPGCGNGNVDYGEGCDDGAGNCDDSVACACSTTCAVPGCGNGAVEPYRGEQCDEGAGNCNAIGCTCSTWCTTPRCGDGHVEGNEECDDGDTGNCNDSPACNCAVGCFLPGCGNGQVEPYLGESCDEGANNCDTAGCTCATTCQIPWVIERAGAPAQYKLRGIWTDGTNAIAVGNNGTILHRSAQGVWTAGNANTTENLNAVRAVGTLVTAVGDNEAWRTWNGTSWTTSSSYNPSNVNHFLDIACSSTSECWFAAHDTTLGGVLRYGAQVPFESANDGDYRAIVYVPNSNPKQYYAVGVGGIFAWYLTNQWYAQTAFTSVTLNGLALAAADEMTAVGDSGTIWRYTTAWAQEVSPVAANLNAVAYAGSSAYAVGNTGTILRRVGTTWTQETAFTNLNLNGVAAAGTLVLAVGDQGIILRRP